MDYQMPMMDGLAATKAIRALRSEKRLVAIIALTASAMTGDRDQCLTAGMDDYIDKPLDRVRLAGLLDHWAARLTVRGPTAPTVPSVTAAPISQKLSKSPPPIDPLLPLPLIDRATFDRLAADHGAAAARQQAERFTDSLFGQLAELQSAIQAQDFGRVAAVAQALDREASDLGFARLAQSLADLDQRAQGRTAVADMVAVASQLARRTVEVARLLLDVETHPDLGLL
jgi:CheY-like chemotaxis protein